jgi:predicted ATPase/DNA-binding SARP family transcriptional activator
MPKLTLTLFGPPQPARDGDPLRLRSRKALALLAYLAVTGARHSRPTLAALLWPESDRQRALKSLRYTLRILRKALEGRWLLADRETAGLDGRQERAVDVLQFRRLLAQCQAHGHAVKETCPQCLPLLDEAVELYRGDFLAGFTLRDSAEFDTWQSLETEALRQELASALERLVARFAAQADVERAGGYAKRWLALDPLCEAAHRALMRLYAGCARMTAALRQYEACAQVLSEELGVSPSAETRDLYEAIRGGRIPELQARPTMISPAPIRPRHNLTPQPTPFVGREEELERIAQRLADPACRLLTLVGPGGMGKSRLAIQSGEEHVPVFRDGVWFVPLAPVGSADLLPSVILEAFDVPRYGGQDPQTQLLNYLRERHLLLNLDNFEHLLEGTPLVAEILRSAPGIRLLVTSRERLNLRGEWLFPLRGMGEPEKEAIIQAGEDGDVIEQAVAVMEGYSAVELFVQCARQVRPDFSPVAAGAGWVARICRLVEGMPLAIELAAPWTRVMGCEAIAREIEGGLGFLATTLRDMPQRHRSMRAVFDHSWGLLSVEERSVLRQVSVFRGGFRREAAEAMAVRPSQSPASLTVLTALVDSSWLRVLPSGRYEMHELVRQYCEEHLEQDPEPSERVRDRHSEYYTAFLDEREARLKGRDQVEALESILEEMGNIRAAWDWAVERGDVEALGRSVASLWLVSERRGWYHEMEQAFGRAAARLTEQLDLIRPDQRALGAEDTTIVLAQIISRQAHHCFRFGSVEEALTLLEESLALLRGVVRSPRQQEASVWTKTMLGWILNHIAIDRPRASQLLQEVLDQATEAGDQWNSVFAAWSLSGSAHRSGQYLRAEAYLRQAIAITDESGDLWWRAWCLDSLNQILWAKGEYQRAASVAEERYQISHRR